MFALARELKMTVRELCQRMDSVELSEWIAYTRWFSAMPDSWEQTSLLVAAVVAPHCDRDKRPKPHQFVPIATPPQHESQDLGALLELRRAFELGGADG